MHVRNLCVGAATMAALMIPAAVQGATPQQVFSGGFEAQDDSPVRLKTGVGQGYHVKAFGAHDFAVTCEGQTTEGSIKRAALKGRIAIGGRGGFKARDDNGDTVLKVRGDIGKRKATGTFHFSGEIEDQDGRKRECDSGQLEWTAELTKGPNVSP